MQFRVLTIPYKSIIKQLLHSMSVKLCTYKVRSQYNGNTCLQQSTSVACTHYNKLTDHLLSNGRSECNMKAPAYVQRIAGWSAVLGATYHYIASCLIEVTATHNGLSSGPIAPHIRMFDTMSIVGS